MRFIYDDAARFLLEQGEATVRRASDVEPEGTEWVADLSRVGGPRRIGPFANRADALKAEVDWLKENWL
jgi:hypothetical protein